MRLPRAYCETRLPKKCREPAWLITLDEFGPINRAGIDRTPLVGSYRDTRLVYHAPSSGGGASIIELSYSGNFDLQRGRVEISPLRAIISLP